MFIMRWYYCNYFESFARRFRMFVGCKKKKKKKGEVTQPRPQVKNDVAPRTWETAVSCYLAVVCINVQSLWRYCIYEWGGKSCAKNEFAQISRSVVQLVKNRTWPPLISPGSSHETLRLLLTGSSHSQASENWTTLPYGADLGKR